MGWVVNNNLSLFHKTILTPKYHSLQVSIVEEEMRELLRENEANKRGMEAKVKRLTQALGDLQTDLLWPPRWFNILVSYVFVWFWLSKDICYISYLLEIVRWLKWWFYLQTISSQLTTWLSLHFTSGLHLWPQAG